MKIGQRVIFSDNGVISDITIAVNDFDEYSANLPIVAAQDKIFIGTTFPFNHKWIEPGVVNAVPSVISVDLWNAGQWQPAADIVDYTSLGGATFGRAGVIQFTPNIENGGWTRQRLSTEVTGLAALEIYEMYWSRWTFSVSVTAGMTLKYIGQRFSKDIDLFAEYPDLNNTALMSAWATSKTNWDDQHALAADYIVQRLVSGNVVCDKSQIMDWQLFKTAAVHKTAHIIYGGFGPSMLENRKLAAESFERALSLKYFNVDKNSDGMVTEYEKRQTVQEMSR